jgi:predicted regulator of Ras-like GTPase activity (Roadblock/LC7/MglB family)
VTDPSDDVRLLTAQLAADPASLVFMQLAEALRRRGQLEAARKVAVTGLHRYPDLADAHHLLARVLGDQRDFERAFDEWDIALRLDPGHAGAHKGIGFLYFVAGDVARAREHLERAAAALPDDEGVRAALERIRDATPDTEAPPAAPTGHRAAGTPSAPGTEHPAPPSAPGHPVPEFDAEAADLVLVDGHGMRLAGRLRAPDGSDVADRVAAELAGVFREAERAARLLGLGEWRTLAAEAAAGHMVVVPAAPDAVLLVARERSVPLGRLAVIAGRTAALARRWLEALA